MTNLAMNTERPVPPETCDRAVAAARAAAAASGVEVREITEIAELTAVGVLFETIWRSARPVTTELLRALSAAGNYVAARLPAASCSARASDFSAIPERAVCTVTSPESPRPVRAVESGMR